MRTTSYRNNTKERYDKRKRVIPKCFRCGHILEGEWQTVHLESNGITAELHLCRWDECEDHVKWILSKDHKDGYRVKVGEYTDTFNMEYLELREFYQQTVTAPPPSRSHNFKMQAQYPDSSQSVMSREDMVGALADEHGMVCQGCYRGFDDPLYLELDHSRPRSDGGEDHIRNRVLLCGPCNRIKSNRLTLSGLREHNKYAGRMMAHPVTAQPMQNSFTDALQVGGVR